MLLICSKPAFNSDMNRRTFVVAGGAVGLVAGGGGLIVSQSRGTDREADDVVTAEVGGIVLRARHAIEDHPDGFSAMPLVYVDPDVVWFDERVERMTEYGNDDIDHGTELIDLPMAEIGAEIDMIQPFAEVQLRLQSRDEVNDLEPPEGSDHHYYLAPSEFFDRLDVSETYRLRVAELTERHREYYGVSGHGRLIDVLG